MILKFYNRFENDIRDGYKTQTIRKYKEDKIYPQSGDILQLYSGSTVKIKEVSCKFTKDIIIKKSSVYINRRRISYYELKTLAIADGFKSIVDFYRFFNKYYELPFRGIIILW